MNAELALSRDVGALEGKVEAHEQALARIDSRLDKLIFGTLFTALTGMGTLLAVILKH
jgi:hypothetical protein